MDRERAVRPGPAVPRNRSRFGWAAETAAAAAVPRRVLRVMQSIPYHAGSATSGVSFEIKKVGGPLIGFV